MSKIIEFSGYEWKVKESQYHGPGPNHWSEDCVRLDKNGLLNLYIKDRKSDSKTRWYCGSLLTKKRINEWFFMPEDYQNKIPHTPVPVHINLWLFKGKAPEDNNRVKVSINEFKYTEI